MSDNARAEMICVKPRSNVFTGPDKLLRLQKFTVTHAMYPVIEDDSLFVYVSKGTGIATVNGVNFRLEPGTMGWLNYYQIFSFEPDLDSELVLKICVYDYQLANYLVFSEREIDRSNALVRAKPFLHLGENALKNVRMSLKEIEYYSEKNDPGSTLIKVALLGMLDTIFCQETIRQHNWPVPNAPLSWNATLYNFSQCTYNISVTDASKHFGASPAEINHSMKMAIGMNFNQLLVRSRIHRALAAILFDGLSFSVLASHSGFSSEIVFFRTFKKIMGMTPQEYREKITSGNQYIYRSSVTNEAFLSIVHFIFNNFSEPISLKAMQKEMFLSQNAIYKLLTDNLGISYKDIVDLFKIRYAESLLVTTDLPVVDISVASGFNSARTFIRVFQRFNEISPSAYRKKLAVGSSYETIHL